MTPTICISPASNSTSFILLVCLFLASSIKPVEAKVSSISNNDQRCSGLFFTPPLRVLEQHLGCNNNRPSSSSVTRSSSGLDAALLTVPRGGAWYFGKKTAARKYRELLEQQVATLDKQLRQSREELALLRRQLKTSQSLLHQTGSPALRTKTAEQQAEKLKALSENQELKYRVQALTREVNQLEKMRDDLQAIIDDQHQKMVELELKLKQKDVDAQNIVQKYEREMEKLKRDIEAKYQQQIADLTLLMKKRVEEAAEHARQAALREAEGTIEKVTALERQRGEKLLEEERKRSEAAVEREKVKMRKLAKALFEREKKLNTIDNDLSAMEAYRSTSTPMAASKSMNSSYKVDTIRKF